MTRATRIFLSLSAAILVAVGGLLTFAPQLLHADASAALSQHAMLSSDLRASGTLLLVCAAFVISAAWRGTQAQAALSLTAVVFLGYGLGRLVGIAASGQVGGTLAFVTGLEWAVGLIALLLLPRTRPLAAA